MEVTLGLSLLWFFFNEFEFVDKLHSGSNPEIFILTDAHWEILL